MGMTESAVNSFLGEIEYSTAKNESGLGYQDPFVTEEQKNRDTQITKLLTKYVESYEQKVKHSVICRYMILVPCILIVCGFGVMLIYLSVQMLHSQGQVEIPDMVSFITTCVSFITLIIGLLTIVTKYFFPENDEQYITTIVEAIQKNDLENKRENAKYTQQESG